MKFHDSAQKKFRLKFHDSAQRRFHSMTLGSVQRRTHLKPLGSAQKILRKKFRATDLWKIRCSAQLSDQRSDQSLPPVYVILLESRN
ncbi:hypothetical protein DWY63_11845 [Blautia sp. AF26-2]|nr:hypothetical protein DWY63_11845 [Blautia sp. AF26-2]